MPADRLEQAVERLRRRVANLELEKARREGAYLSVVSPIGNITNEARDETPFERLRRLHAVLMSTGDESVERSTLKLIYGGRDDA